MAVEQSLEHHLDRSPTPPPEETQTLQKASSQVRLIICILLLACPMVAGVMIGWSLRIHDFENAVAETQFPGRNVVYFQANLITVDPLGGTMTLDWFITGDTCLSPDTPACTSVNIYFDMNVLAGTGEFSSNNRPKYPFFAYNATSLFLDDSRANIAAFRTPVALLYPDQGTASLQNYPFDKYFVQIFVYAQDADTNATVGVSIQRTRGVAVGFCVQAMQNDSLRDMNGVLDDKIVISRGILVKAYALVIVAAIWLITLIFLLATVYSIIFGYSQKENVLVIPIAGLFAFTQLRTTMPGAPDGFGAIIDYVGLLPCLALITISAILTIGSLVLSDPTRDRNTLFDEMWHKLRTSRHNSPNVKASV